MLVEISNKHKPQKHLFIKRNDMMRW